MTPGHLGEWRQLEHSSAPSRASFQVLCGSLGQATGSGPFDDPGCVGVGPRLSTCVRHSRRQGATSRPFSRGVRKNDPHWPRAPPAPVPETQAALAVGGLRSDPDARAAGPNPRPAPRGIGAPLTSRPHGISSAASGRSVRGQGKKVKRVEEPAGRRRRRHGAGQSAVAPVLHGGNNMATGRGGAREKRAGPSRRGGARGGGSPGIIWGLGQ